ncbi:MAG: xanthine dehydrogenase small subunit [Stenomitos rutilans HA7619-LM2]|jgi:xanthine dehydrogenase small subunit|nr:xanthine dehydrogenase small subunit [Stenomitos rutilans HA7619-LM2]
MSDVTLTLTINGALVPLKNVSPTMTLLEYLRDSGRVGTKEGCGDGDCGACTVAIVAEGADGKPQYQAMNSCLIPLASVAGQDIITVEGVANGALHPVQAAMVETMGSQCGYCTPGFIMSLFTAYYDRAVDDFSLEGNLCRCTGYLSIRRAAELVNETAPDDTFATHLNQASAELVPLDYSGNDQYFYRPTHLSGVLTLLQQHPDATLVAGATDLGLELTHRRQHFPVMISLEAVAELKQVEQTLDAVTIGAAVPLSHIETNLHGIFPSLDEMLHWFAARQVRNRATIGGNLGTASPIGDLPPVLLALDAEITIASITGTRILPLADFFKGYRQTDLKPGEVIVSVTIPKAIALGAVRRLSQSYKIGKRGTDDISIVAAAFTIDLDANDRIVHARLAYGGVAATPVRAIAVETMLMGQPWTLATIQNIKPTLKAAFTPLTDLRGSADYRKLLIANLFEKFFVECQSPEETVAGVVLM